MQENKAEASTVWKMFKEDPLSPGGSYWKNFGIPGIGLFLEGYVVHMETSIAALLQTRTDKTC